MASDKSWQKIFDDHDIFKHDFSTSPFYLNASQIKESCQDFKKTAEKEVRILCKQDSRKDRPQVFQDLGLFLLPVKNGEYAILEGEGYFDIPEIKTPLVSHKSRLDFSLDTVKVGDSEMQHLDYAYAVSIIRSFIGDETLELIIRGRKYTPEFSFKAGKHGQELTVSGVQTEVDGGYEGKNNVVLVEAKNASTKNVIIRQIYYPFRQWSEATAKPVHLVFFEKRGDEYHLYKCSFENKKDYNAVKISASARYKLEA